MDIDKSLDDLGSFGRYQVTFIILLAILQGVFPSWQIFSSVFILYEPPYRCKSTFDNISIPLGDDGEPDACLMYKYAYDYHSDSNASETIPCEDGWMYDVSENEQTFVTEMDLVCERSILATNAVSIFFCGILVGALLNGQLSDMFGRKTVVWIAMVIGIIAGTCLAFTQSYAAFVSVWFVVAMCQVTTSSSTFILIVELFPPKQRTLAACITTVAWGIGLCAVTPIAYYFQNWRHFQLAITLPVILFLPTWWFVVESPRWLSAKNRHSDVRKVLDKMAKFNGVARGSYSWHLTHITSDGNSKEERSLVGKETLKDGIKNVDINQRKPQVFTILDTVRTPELRKNSIIMCYVCMVYYGLALNSSSLAGDRFINFLILCAAEIPAYLITMYLMPRVGRRKLALVFHVIATVACILMTVIPETTGNGINLTALITSMAFVARFSITSSYTIIWIFSTEIYPTVIRNIGIGECSMAARIGGITAPYIMYLGKSLLWLPMIVFAVLSMSAGLVVLLLPEALNRPLPETIEDGENFKNAIPVTAGYSAAANDDDNDDAAFTKV